jgi:hypothetical protein
MQMGVRTEVVAGIKEPVGERRMTRIISQAQAHRDLGLPVERDLIPLMPEAINGSVRVGLYKSWTASMDEGWTRWVFDTFHVRYKTILDKNIREGNLRARYDVIILPSQRAREIIEGHAPGSYPQEFTGGITLAGVNHLRRFVEEGGTLICFDASTELPIKNFTLPTSKGNAGAANAFPLRNVLEGLRSSDFYCPGSILSIDVDTTHALARGLPSKMDAYFINSSAFEVTDGERVRVVARYAEQNVLRSGWLLGEARIAGRIALAEVPMGRGRVVLFGFRPQHRGQTWGTFPLVFNSIKTSAP